MTWTWLATALAAQWLAFACVMAAAWVVQQRTGNSGWVDVAWTFGLGAIAAVAAVAPVSNTSELARQILVASLSLIWALRLGGQLVQRTLSTDDDPRYRDLARQWGDAAAARMFGLLQLQALVSIPLFASIFIAAHRPGDAFDLADVLGIALVLIAVAGEGLADRQLWRFRHTANNDGRVCDAGLWRYSRHPNYFFQWLGWLGYPLIAMDLSGGYALGWLALLGPLCMYVLLVHVSGIPPLEAHMLRSRGDAYRDYQSRTSAFFPLPPAHSTERSDEHSRRSHQSL